MLSFAPAARIEGLTGLTATAGSFCLFWEKMVSLLPTVTSVSGINAAAGPAASITTSDNSRPTRTARGLRRMGPPLDRQRPPLRYKRTEPPGIPVTPYFRMRRVCGHQQGAGTPCSGEQEAG